MIEEVTKSVALEFHRLHGEIEQRDKSIRYLLDLLQASYVLSQDKGDSIIGLDVDYDFADYIQMLKTEFSGQIHSGE